MAGTLKKKLGVDIAPKTTTVEAIDPAMMHQLTGNDAMRPVAQRIGGLLQAAFDSLHG